MTGGIDGTLPIVGVLWCFDAEWVEPESLKEEVELLKPPLRKLESILTGEGGRNDLDLSPSVATRIDLKILE